MFYGLSLSHPYLLLPPKPQSQQQCPPFSIHPLLPPDYIEAFTLADTAFATLNSLLFTTYPPSPESQRILTDTRLKALAATQAIMFKAVDNHTGRIVGVARWTVSAGENVENTLDEAVEEILARSIPETNEACARGFYSMAWNARREILGIPDEEGNVVKLAPRVELETLFVHPEYKREGVARALLQWGIEEARRLRVVVYAEVAEGRPVYEQAGFEAVKTVDFDAQGFGGVGTHRYTFMLRRPSE
ncbi:hypothetical protein ASPVEDRAFT_89795 [Aspergillus versicolor CBS 583.65]|uniref:N-acetyltransferase domain-containing protein n=1 Tax=Aspergillus versicolor CBS 583.65 TaxID=1036611 RepID=A0A1L9Q490_ASPVE|nr:uncharacterized protein ASPVEDRAFT_89795 [Aspergillus versicolor CBS 583.65]OJJ08584.1 hypothetical protein ASPVEDRAFT_89795 [Aspergillus versicolor CBS 583.65]